MKPTIMYIENEVGGIGGPAHIGRVRFSHSGKSIYHGGKRYRD